MPAAASAPIRAAAVRNLRVFLGWGAAGALAGEALRRLLAAHPVAVPAFAGLPLLLIAAVLLWYGWRVRRLRRGRAESLSRLAALRVAAGAAAGLRSGALLAGAGGVLAIMSALGSTAFTRASARAWAILTAAALVLAVVGWIVDTWCRIERR